MQLDPIKLRGFAAVCHRVRGGSQMIGKLTLASGIVAFGLLGVPLGADANQINLLGSATNPASPGITFTGTGTLVNVSIGAGTGNGAVFQATGFPNVLGTYTLGAV